MVSNEVLERRKMRQEINDDFSEMIIKKFDLKDTSKCLEIGAGLGSIAYFLADHCKNGIIDVIDLKKENVDEILKNKRENMNVKQIAIQDEYFKNKKYDFIHARFVFEHIDNPKSIVDNIIKNNLETNGILFLEDAVYDNVEFIGDDIYKKVMHAYMNVIKKDGSNYSWGMQMDNCFRDCGLSDVNSLGIIRVLNGASKETRFWQYSLKENYDNILMEGITKEEIMDAIDNMSRIDKWFSGPIVMGTYGIKLT